MEREVFRSGPFTRSFAQAVRSGDTIHLAGQVAMDEAGEIIGIGDIAVQVAQVYRNAAAVLAHFGAEMRHAASETWFVVDMGDYLRHGREIAALRRAAYGGEDPPVTQTVVQVSALYRPEVLVEVQFVAHL